MAAYLFRYHSLFWSSFLFLRKCWIWRKIIKATSTKSSPPYLQPLHRKLHLQSPTCFYLTYLILPELPSINTSSTKHSVPCLQAVAFIISRHGHTDFTLTLTPNPKSIHLTGNWFLPFLPYLIILAKILKAVGNIVLQPHKCTLIQNHRQSWYFPDNWFKLVVGSLILMSKVR